MKVLFLIPILVLSFTLVNAETKMTKESATKIKNKIVSIINKKASHEVSDAKGFVVYLKNAKSYIGLIARTRKDHQKEIEKRLSGSDDDLKVDFSSLKIISDFEYWETINRTWGEFREHFEDNRMPESLSKALYDTRQGYVFGWSEHLAETEYLKRFVLLQGEGYPTYAVVIKTYFYN